MDMLLAVLAVLQAIQIILFLQLELKRFRRDPKWLRQMKKDLPQEEVEEWLRENTF